MGKMTKHDTISRDDMTRHDIPHGTHHEGLSRDTQQRHTTRERQRESREGCAAPDKQDVHQTNNMCQQQINNMCQRVPRREGRDVS